MSAGDGDGGVSGPTRELEFRLDLRFGLRFLRENHKRRGFGLFGVHGLIWLQTQTGQAGPGCGVFGYR